MDSFISALICAAQNGYACEVDPLVALCRETWREESLFDALKDLPHGRQHRTRLMYAAHSGNPERARWLLARGARLELRDSAGRSALFWGAREGHCGVLHVLLDHGAQCNAAKHNSFTSTYVASQNGHVNALRALLQRGASLHPKALYIARMHGRYDVFAPFPHLFCTSPLALTAPHTTSPQVVMHLKNLAPRGGG